MKHSSQAIETGHTAGRSLPTRLFYTVATLIVVLHVYAAFYPSSLNWGFHALAFFSLPAKLVWILLALLILVPPSRRFLLHLTERTVERISRIPRSAVYAILLVCWAALCWFAHTRWYLLGDGQLTLRDVARAVTLNAPPPVQFRTEPLSIFINVQLFKMLSRLGGADVVMAFRIIGVVSGVAFLLTIFLLIRRLTENTTERILLGAFILFAGSSLLFLGYAEDYTILYAVLFGYLVLSYSFLRGGCSLVLPSIAFAVMVTLHLGAIFFAPSLLVLLYVQFRKKWHQGLFAVGTAAVVGLVVLMLIGYQPLKLFKVLGGGGSYLIPLAKVSNPNQNFPFLSWQYFLEQFNLQILVSPFALLLLIIFVAGSRREIRWTAPPLFFLIVAALCGCAFVAVANPNLGLSRDWDLFSFNLLPLIFLVAVVYGRHVKLEGKKELLFTAACLTLLHTIPWVTLNTSENKSLARHRILPDERLWGESARLSNLDELGAYYRNKSMYKEALEAYRGYLAINSGNPRTYQSIATVYQFMGDKEQQRLALEEAIRRGWRGAEAFIDLGMLVWDRHEIDRAIELTSKGLAINPGLSPGYHNLGVFYLYGRHDFKNSLDNFEMAIEADPEDTTAYKGAAISAYFTQDLEKARIYARRYLEDVPSDPEALQLVSLLDQAPRQRPGQR
ncbi:MAG: hypothetical protein QME66_03760 [Candidatus Eisenbacteria bacterium]|nr:hypothetical protein [Candidatus Eisenbacteria bacterium]